jgi:SAM-dependent methyltransferase
LPFTPNRAICRGMTSYGRLCTAFYDIDKPAPPPAALAFYTGFAERARGPVLEAMCGSGRFLLPLLAKGLDVDGVDAASAMLAACRDRARRCGVAPRLREERIEELSLDRRYSLVFVTAGSFALIVDPALARRALEQMFRVLLPGGTLLLELPLRAERPREDWSGPWGGRWVEGDGGTKIVLSWLSRYSAREGTTRSIHRYELVRDGAPIETEIEELAVRDYEADELTAMLRDAGFGEARFYRDYQLAEGPGRTPVGEFVVECARPGH